MFESLNEQNLDELNSLLESCTDEELEDFNEKFERLPHDKQRAVLGKLSPKSKAKLNEHDIQSAEASFDKIIEIMKKGKYENLPDV